MGIVTWSDDFPTGTRVTSIDSVIYAYLEEAGTYIVSVEDYNIFKQVMSLDPHYMIIPSI